MIELIECLCFLVAYFLPSIVALLHRKPVTTIFVINLLLGWTILGWVIAIAMACTNNKK